jgi:hypothetical protein
MLKITAEQQPTYGRVFRVEGRLIGPWVFELQDHCDRALRDYPQLTLDLSGVLFADVRGIDLLNALVRRSVALARPTPFIAAQLGEKQP